MLESARFLLVGEAEWLDAFAEQVERRFDASVRTASSVDTALDAYQSQAVDCIVTEYELDGATGIQLLRSIREDTAMLPVILCTASGDEAVASEAIADDVQATLVIEGANGPTTTGGDAILRARDLPVIPDILANAGGVTVSYFEWLQDINRRAWSIEQVHEELEAEMLSAWNEVRREYESRAVTWREASYIVALSRLAEAHESRGLWP
jgi:glutamate dehydrogenase (NAD(P)+)